MKYAKEKKPSGFSVKATCKKLGLGPHTLRAWESRYKAVEPTRSNKGQRLYSQEQIDRLEKIVQLVNLGHAVGIVARLSDKDLAQLYSRTLTKKLGQSHSSTGVSPLMDLLEDSLKRFDVHAVSSILDQRRISLGVRPFIMEILTPLMSWIGRLVDKGELSIAHEHALSAVVRDQLYQTLRYGAQSIQQNSPLRFVLAAPEDDLHEFGILMSSALLSNYGLTCHLLGANLPVEALAIAVKAVRGNIIILGNAPIPETERKITFEKYLLQLHVLIPKDVAVWIGGSGTVPHLRHVMPGRETKYISSLEELDTQGRGQIKTHRKGHV